MTYTFAFGELWEARWELLWGALLTLRLSAAAMAIGLVIAVLCAYGRMAGPRIVGRIVAGYVELVRNTPLLVQAFLIYFGLPSVGISLSPEQGALLALSFNVGAYAAEIVRSGIESIPPGQAEAGLALGLRRGQVFRKIELFQALAAIFPALSSQFILLLLASSIMSAIAAQELTAVASDIQGRTFRSFETYLVVTGIYLGLALGFSTLFSLIEAKILRRHLTGSRS